MTAIITEPLIERCATSGYEAVMANAGPHCDPWEKAPEQQRRTLRLIARAVLVEALQPDKPGGPMDGQEVLV